MNFHAYLKKQSRSFTILIGFTLIGIIGICDFLTGYEIVFLLFYVIPISSLTWFIGRWIGIMASFISAIVWFWADMASGHPYTQPLIPLLNSLLSLSFFVMITLLLSILRSTLDHEKELARIDNLTGAVNSRLFFVLLQMEMDRLQRYKHTFTLVYLDLDNFKAVNDQYGHLTGNQVLRRVVSYAKMHLRNVDVIARIGGDEFAVLLPETSYESAQVVVTRLQSGLLEEMKQRNWPITFSIGVVTCNAAQCAAEELVRIADNLMYTIKHDGKNAIKYTNFVG